MKAALLVAASAALVRAQVTQNSTTGQFTCAKPNAAFCAGESLGTDIIIRCDANGNGQPGRCTDNLAGEPPVGVNPALCYQSSDTAGDAACEKNCVVYGTTSFTLPATLCTPTFTASPTTTTTASSTGSGTSSPPTTTVTYPSTTMSTTTTTCPPTSTAAPPPPPPAGNGTCTTCGGGSSSATNTPQSPTTTQSAPTTVVTAGAATNRVAAALAAVGLVAAYFL